ncbi:TIGR03086 family metal-binding protein [Pseudonocardia sp. GCM10023141]|uniref:TIGR03086 family metal-binding protein n=1 Tax=Pseudonocardia sp. GCM10023141 TaxID=3252653 RepID=UPI003623D42E
MDHADHLSQSIDLAVATIRGADPARYGDPSPCTEYTVGQVVNHLAFGLLLAECAATRTEWGADWGTDPRAPFLRDVPESEWADRASVQAEQTARAWAEPDAWVGDTTFGGAPMPAAAVGSMMTGEFVVHSWDVAIATGQPIEVPDGLGAAAYEGIASMAPAGREAGWIAPEVKVGEDASPFVRTLGVAGRDPNWSAP